MAGLGKLAKMVNKATQIKSPTEQFLFDLDATIIAENKPTKPAANFKPSMLGGCLRRTYFCVTGAEPDLTAPSANFIGICESGSARHEHIQSYVQLMQKHGYDWEWVDVEEFVKRRKPPGTRIVKRVGNEVKLYNDILDLSFMCDGVLKHGGKYYILEIKTEVSFKYMKHTEVHQEHLTQSCSYSACLGIEDIIFIYENRDICTKKTPPKALHITDEMRQTHVVDRVETVRTHVTEGTVPPKEKGKCNYCNYTTECKKWGD